MVGGVGAETKDAADIPVMRGRMRRTRRMIMSKGRLKGRGWMRMLREEPPS